MKVLYSELKRYLPDLKASAQEVAQAYTLIGFMIDKFHEVEFDGKKDYFLDLEVRQNRADLFGIMGLARELSAYYDIPMVVDGAPIDSKLDTIKVESDKKLSIEVKAKDRVKRVCAVEISDIEIGESPQWLKEYLALYEINSINNLVDITNYVMLQTAHASHVFDADLVGNNLVWEINPDYKKFTTLNGEEIELTEDTLVISDGNRPLSLSFIGGKEDAVNPNTKRVILEVAVYDGGLVRKNSRALKIQTEAGARLEKYLDPTSIPQALHLLVSMITEICKGKLTSQVFDEYIQVTDVKEIRVDLDKVQQIAGMEISHEESKTYLKRLGFNIIGIKENIILVERPINRLDIELEEDVFEEIIRLKGFDNIPTDNLYSKIVKDVTPERIKIAERVNSILINNGYDEVRSWVLVDEQSNAEANFSGFKPIEVTNSINEEVPFLRQNLGVSLIGQLKENRKNNISPINLFEIGKVFYSENDTYKEEEYFGMIADNKSFNAFKLDVERVVRTLGLSEVVFKQTTKTPKVAHTLSTYEVYAFGTLIGLVYQSNAEYTESFVLAEININKIEEVLLNHKAQSTYEVGSKIVDLDVNFELASDTNLEEFILNKIKPIKENVWSYNVIDTFKLDEDTNRVTYKIAYINLSDQEAKKLHETL